jgi:hypothetical protein
MGPDITCPIILQIWIYSSSDHGPPYNYVLQILISHIMRVLKLTLGTRVISRVPCIYELHIFKNMLYLFLKYEVITVVHI